MTTYFIKCDLCGKADYSSLIKEFGSRNAEHIINSTWLVKSNETSASKLRNHFRQFISENDSILVINANDWAICRPHGDSNQGSV